MAACTDSCEHDIPVEKPSLLASKPVRASALCWLFALAGLLAGTWDAGQALAVGLFAAAIASGSFYFAREAVQELLEEREVGIELLMTLAIAGAAALGGWREAALVAALYSISEALEGFTIQRTRFAIRSLMDLVPPRATVLRNGRDIELAVEDVRVGDLVRIRPGESISIDGVIREGTTAIDESPVTGESLPVDRNVGDTVFAGTLNGNGVLLVEATRPFAENTVSKIIHLVEEAQKQKAATQLFVERFGRIYSPAVLGAGLLIALGGLAAADTESWLRKAVSFLVAAAPCALAVATPVTVVAAIGAAARNGVLIKGGAILETMGRLRAVALDKTGTITWGKPSLTGVLASQASEEEILALAAALERYSEHPLAAAVVRAAEEKNVPRLTAAGVRALTAAGLEGAIGTDTIFVLKPAAAAERGIQLSAQEQAWRHDAEGTGRTTVVVARGRQSLGLLAIADTVRPEAAGLVRLLRTAGIEHVVMLTGDNEATAKAIAAQVGIEEVAAGLLPEDKVSRVRSLRERYGTVAMIGDGINDAPALAEASVGIAMGTGGSDAALAAADVALVKDDLSKLEYAIDLGRRSRGVILQNLAAAVAIVLVLVAGTLGADLSMLAAVLGHEGSEVLIILNGLRVALAK